MIASPDTRSLALRIAPRLAMLATALAIVVPGLAARPALAASPQVSVTITQRWSLGGTEGTWTPYVVSVTDQGPSAVSGTLALLPQDSRQASAASYPAYQTSVNIARGTSRSFLVYVVDAPGGYSALLRDDSGRVVARADANAANRSSTAVGILSDLTQAEQKIGAPLRTLSRVDASLTRFGSAQDFPTNAVYLSGLSSLVVDQFDSAALSQAQVQALKDFVGLGGALIEAGGPSWRRTLLSLPSELLPMRPTSTATVTLGPLAELAGRATDATAQVASGDVGQTTRVTLEAPDGTPLVVEGTYGAGRVVELTFDPFAGPFDTQVDLAGIAWAHAISQALSGIQGSSRQVGFAGGFGASSSYAAATSTSAPPGGWAPGYNSSTQDQLNNVLDDTPAAAAPPVGLLGGMLVAYVLLAGLLNYLFLKALGQRVLLWVSVPLVAIVATAGAYAVGFGGRGTDFVVTEAQVQLLGPEGTAEAYSFDGVYPPRKGDVLLDVPGNTLVSTAISQADSDAPTDTVITTGPHPQVLLGNVAVWDMQPVQTLTVAHPYSYEPKQSMPIDVQLGLSKGRIQGRVTNLTNRVIGDLELVSASGTEATVAASLAPGASTNVDVPLGQTAGGTIVAPTNSGGGPSVRGLSDSSRDSLIRLAASEASSRPGDLAIVGFAGTTDGLGVDGGSSPRSAEAALVEPFQLKSADSLTGVTPRARWVSNYFAADSTQVDVYDFDLPSGLTAPTGLTYQMLDGSQGGVSSVEVYNWATHIWRALPKQSIPARGQAPAPLAAGEVGGGLVRVRVVEALPFQAQLAVGDLPTTAPGSGT